MDAEPVRMLLPQVLSICLRHKAAKVDMLRYDIDRVETRIQANIRIRPCRMKALDLRQQPPDSERPIERHGRHGASIIPSVS